MMNIITKDKGIVSYRKMLRAVKFNTGLLKNSSVRTATTSASPFFSLTNSKLAFTGFNKARFIHIKTETTPNDNSLKFLSTDGESFLTGTSSIEIKNSDQELIKHSSLARTLFVQCPGIESIMIGQKFITINKDAFLHWNQLTNDVIEILTKHLAKGDESVDEAKYHSTIKEQEGYEINVPKFELNEEQQEISEMIAELIETRIRPAVQDDGGDILYRGFDPEKGIVYLKLQGACKSCSSSEDTLKHGIEGMLKHYVDEVEEVVQILDPEEEIALKEFDKLEERLKKSKE